MRPDRRPTPRKDNPNAGGTGRGDQGEHEDDEMDLDLRGGDSGERDEKEEDKGGHKGTRKRAGGGSSTRH